MNELTKENIERMMLNINLLEIVAPRLTATGLPCIANPEIMSSGNTQHLGTEITALMKVAEA